MTEIIFASSNQHKIAEINALMPAGYVVKGLKDAGIIGDIAETGSTIPENSLIKAKYVAERLPGLAVFADDSGLEVEALKGAPGVYSARYAGEPKNDAANNQKLLQELKQITKRRARFVTVITLIMDGDIKVFEGEVVGTIAYEARGKNGFGYDPLFIPQGYRSTFAELSAEEKNRISHRAKAVKAMCDYLEARRRR